MVDASDKIILFIIMTEKYSFTRMADARDIRIQK